MLAVLRTCPAQDRVMSVLGTAASVPGVWRGSQLLIVMSLNVVFVQNPL